jgi:hypothetical protein
VRRLLAILGGIALLRAWLARRRSQPAVDPADDLRRKLEETRELAADQEEFAAGETPVDVDDRRRDVHERGRAAIDEMRSDG